MDDRIKELKADIQHEMASLKKLLKEMEEISLDRNITSRRAVGSILQDSYNCCERIFRMMAREVNGVFPVGLDWPKQLLNQVQGPRIELQAVCDRLSKIQGSMSETVSELRAERE